jgi:outer membrane murein-binding lipoprotein Lpp
MKSTRFGIALVTAVLAASALSGCSQVAEIRDVASDVAEQVAASGTERISQAVSGNLLTTEGIDAAYLAISAKVGAAPMQVVEVTIIPTVMTVEAIDPNAPTELNQWSYTAGAVGPSRPVDYDDDTEALQQNLFAVNEVPTEAIVFAINNAIAASEIPGGAVQSLIIKRNIPFDDNVTMFINVEGERSSKQVRADVAGQITDVV